jgi:hypothetical protein
MLVMPNEKAKERFEPILAEFREGIAHHRAEGASEGRIKQILAAAVRLAVEQVDDPVLCIWLCEEFTRIARLAPIVANHPATPRLQ